jgi:L-asparagine transporter-like permease
MINSIIEIAGTCFEYLLAIFTLLFLMLVYEYGLGAEMLFKEMRREKKNQREIGAASKAIAVGYFIISLTVHLIDMLLYPELRGSHYFLFITILFMFSFLFKKILFVFEWKPNKKKI